MNFYLLVKLPFRDFSRDLPNLFFCLVKYALRCKTHGEHFDKLIGALEDVVVIHAFLTKRKH